MSAKQTEYDDLVEFTVQTAAPLVQKISAYAQEAEMPVDQWASAHLLAAVVATDITQHRQKNAQPGDLFSPMPELGVEDTPPAFTVPYGPIPALERPSLPPLTAEQGQEYVSRKGDQPPTIELLPESNPGAYWEHIVQPGETLSSIAHLYYGNSGLYGNIASANNIHPPYIIYTGQLLIVLKPELSPQSASKFSGQCVAWNYHTVQPGESLGSIANFYYNNGGEFWRIANCNNILGPNYVIYAGQVLAIPNRWV